MLLIVVLKLVGGTELRKFPREFTKPFVIGKIKYRYNFFKTSIHFLSAQNKPCIRLKGRLQRGPVVPDCPAPYLNNVSPILCLVPRLLRRSNIVSKKCGPACDFNPPAAKSWRRA